MVNVVVDLGAVSVVVDSEGVSDVVVDSWVEVDRTDKELMDATDATDIVD